MLKLCQFGSDPVFCQIWIRKFFVTGCRSDSSKFHYLYYKKCISCTGQQNRLHFLLSQYGIQQHQMDFFLNFKQDPDMDPHRTTVL